LETRFGLSVFIIIWEYIVAEGQQAEFERVYGPEGEWAQLFKKAKGYIGTELLRDSDRPRHYITIDRWDSSSAFDSFQENYHGEYEAIDARSENLTERETRIGVGTIILST
jgi:heme-degrading monooxygenase HmoA